MLTYFVNKIQLKLNLKLKILVLNINISISKNKKKSTIKILTILTIIVASILSNPSFFANSFPDFDSEKNLDNRLKTSNDGLRIMVDSEPIHIESNQGWIDLKNAGRCTGTGTENDPYFIRDIKINGTGYDFCILIEHSNDYFVIENVDVYNARISLIKLSNTTNGKVINCQIHDCHQGWGIYLIDWCDKNNISSNYIYNNNGLDSGGIAIIYSDDNIVASNLLENNKVGIRVASLSGGNKISTNYIYSSQMGICFSGEVCYSIISDNYFSNNQYEAISLDSTWYSHLWGSIITGNIVEDGLFISDTISEDDNLIAVNSINGIYTPIHIDDSGLNDFTWQEAALYSWCSGTGTETDPYKISNMKIDAQKIQSSITIENSKNSYWVIENCELMNSGDYFYDGGLKLVNANLGKVWGNIIHNNLGQGISIDDDSIYNEFNRNIIRDNRLYGICTYINSPRSDEVMNANEILNNEIIENGVGGIFIDYGSHRVAYNLIMENNVNGIVVSSTCSLPVSIEANLIRNNDGSGILALDGILNCTRNRFENNRIFLYINVFNSFIYENIFLFSYADDSGQNNQWYYNSVGNIWSNYKGQDNNDDGFGDTSHPISDPWICDLHPIWNDGIENEDIAIHIDDSSLFTFNWVFARIHKICTGSGLLDDPYILKNLVIDGLGINKGILIENSDVYFKIDDIDIDNTLDYGVKFINVNNGTINKIDIKGSSNGIYLENSNNNTIKKNKIHDTRGKGIYLINSHENRIEDCIIKNNYESGICFELSDNNIIIGCEFSENRLYGVKLQDFCDNNLITYNLFYSNIGYPLPSVDFSVILVRNHCSNLKIINNEITENYRLPGITIKNSSNIEISENIVDGHFSDGLNSVGINCYNHCENITISSNEISHFISAGIYLYEVNKTLIKNNHIQYIIGKSYHAGITALNSKEVRIFENQIANCKCLGIQINQCLDINFTFNDIHNNTEDGIKISNYITSCILSQNKIYSNYKNGIYVENGEELLITGNLIQSNQQNGLEIAAEGTFIISNYITENVGNGIKLTGDHNSVLKNKIYFNEGNGIEISSNNNIIRKNHIQDNIDFGIHATDESTDNLIYENILYHNYGISIDPHISPYYDAFDSGSSNAWNNTAIGNFWSLGYFYDENPKDGINDYPIFFPEEKGDYYPIYNASDYEFKKVEVNPNSLYPGEPILITCHFSEDWGIKNVFANIKKSDGTIITTIDLFDDGSHSDKKIGDMVYTNSFDTWELEAIAYEIDVYYEDFIFVINSKLDAASFVINLPRTLILVHGYNGNSAQFSSIYNNPDVIETYGERIIRIDYYDHFMGEDINWWRPGISTIADLLAEYIKSHHLDIRGNIDFVCHSMGGLVVRYMIKHHYKSLKQFYGNKPGQFEIKHVCQLATPNHGVDWFLLGLFVFNLLSAQMNDMVPGGPFLEGTLFESGLNDPDETPYGETIDWYTYRGSDDWVAYPITSIPLEGAVENRGPYPGLNHDTILTDPECLNDLFSDLDIPGYEQFTLTETGIPLQEDTSIEISSLQLDSPPVEPSLNLMSLHTHLILENNAPIDPTSVKIKINPEYNMFLKSGTISIFELNFTLPDGIYTYLITALDLDGNQYSIAGQLIIIDDDTTPPFITYTYYGDHTDGNSGFIRVIASDFSGLSIDPSDDYPVPNRLGTHFFSFLAKDNDNDRSEDSLSTTLEVSITIEDDDTVKPEIIIDYFGSGTDGDPGYFSWYITDTDNGIGGDGDTGFSMIDIKVIYTSEDGLTTQEFIISPTEAGTWNLPPVLGTYEIIIEAVDNDDDRTIVIDALSTTLTEIQTIIDDDTSPPEIAIEYIGEGNDFNPGYFGWDIFDADSGLSEINITIIYESTEGLDDYIISFEGTETGSWNLPSNLGTYTIIITARDNDDDRTLIIDSLSTEVQGIQDIIDDDISPPELSDLEITAGIFEINISLVALDESGIKNITLLINGEVIEPISQIQDGNTYFFIVSNYWLFEKGFSEVEVLVEDGDNDRPSDSLFSSISGSFKNVLYQMYEYVDFQLEELKDFIEENLCTKASHSIVKKLSQAQEKLIEAFNLIENGTITSGLMKVYLAKIYITIAEHKTYIYNKINWINDDNASYIIQSLHNIRNNIVYLKGASTGVKQAVDISYIEVELLNLVDFIGQNVKSRSLSNSIRVSAEILDIAIILISLNENPKELLCYVQDKLEYAICKIDHLLRKERISQELADYIINKISQQIEAIETVKDSLVFNESLL